ncbi:MAG: hypothetical protein J6Q95_03940 [Alistipes sp.]|nr:hypothetical protein [Alistipes sp.]
MKRFFMSIKSAVLSMAVVALMASSVVSCQYDDSALWNEVKNIKQELADLRLQLETELNAVKDLVNGQVTVKEVNSQKDGSKIIVLSDGTKVTVYPKSADVPANIVTVVSEGGVMYWAMYDGVGNVQPILVNGQKVPVAEIAPQTQVVDGAIEVSFDGGKTWIKTGYNNSVADSIIKDIEVVYSDWQTDAEGNPVALYCKITMADGSIVKVGMQNGKLVLPYDMMFVPYGSEMPFAINIDDVADFINTNPRGWECDIEHNAKKGTMTLTFYAPTFEEVEAGEAVAEGVAKLMVVFNNGSSAIASIKLSTTPAKVNFTLDGVYIEAGYGTNYLLCGIIGVNSYSEQTITNNCNKVLADGSTLSGINQVAFMEEQSTFIEYSELRSAPLKAGDSYTFWYVAPRTAEDGSLYVETCEIVTETYKHSSIDFTTTATSFFDVDVKFEVKGSEGYMLGYKKAAEFDAAALATYYTENYDYLNATREDVTYTGSFLELMEASEKLDNGTEYVVYYIAKNKNREILEDNIHYWSFTTADFVEGGDLEVEIVGEPVVEYKDIYLDLNSNGEHIMLIYNAMPSYMATAYPDDSYIVNMLLNDGVRTITDGAVSAHYKGTEPGEAVTLFAVAIDKEGKIGTPLKCEFKTKDFEYNDLSVALTLVDYKIDNTLINVACEGASYFKYILCSLSDSKWKDVYGGSAKKAGEYIIMNPNASDIHNTTEEALTEEGNIFLKGLNTDTEYVLVCVAVDENGVVSKPATCYFEPIANIGNMVKRTDANWADGKPTITLGDTAEVEFFNFSWYTTPQKGYVAYSMADHPGNLQSDYYGTNVNTPEKLIAYIVAGCDNGQRECGHKCVYSEDGYSYVWQEMEDLNGDGRIEFDEWVEKSIDNLPGVYNSYFYGTKGEHRIYVTWVGEDGNFHEPFVFDPTTGQEEELNAANFPAYFE